MCGSLPPMRETLLEFLALAPAWPSPTTTMQGVNQQVEGAYLCVTLSFKCINKACT